MRRTALCAAADAERWAETARDPLNTIQQLLNAGLLDEIPVDIAKA